MNQKVFNLIPTNDEQAEYLLRHGKSTITADALYGIYQCKRGLGLSVLDAYAAALQARVSAYENGEGGEGPRWTRKSHFVSPITS